MIKYWESPSRAATLAILQLCPVANKLDVEVNGFPNTSLKEVLS